MNWMVKMVTRIVKVNSLAVANRWLGQMKDTYHESHLMKLGIWETQPQGRSRYQYQDNTIYVVGHCRSVEQKVNHLGKRIA